MSNRLLILVFCALSLLFAHSADAASGASLYFSPNSGTFLVGGTFDVSVFVNTGGNSINAVRADLEFDHKKIQITNPTSGKSFISVWIAQPNYSNIQGLASFQGGVPSPGINTTAGLISTITFRAIAPGETSIYFSENSQVLLNDGQGTDVLDSLSRGVYTLKIPPPEGPIVYSPTHPDQNKWYKNNSPSLSWEKENGVTDFSYNIDHDFSGVPDNSSEGNLTSVSYADLDDGIWYFHIKAKKAGAWGGISHYAIQADNTPPAIFSIDFEPKLKSKLYASKEPIVTFITTDAMSGMEHYELKVIDLDHAGGADFFVEVSSPYRLPTLNSGENEIVVRAFDVAGNWQDSSKKVEVIPSDKFIYITKSGLYIWIFFLPWWLLILLILILLIVILIIIIFYQKKDKNLQEKRNNLQEIKENTEKNTWINT